MGGDSWVTKYVLETVPVELRLQKFCNEFLEVGRLQKCQWRGY